MPLSLHRSAFTLLASITFSCASGASHPQSHSSTVAHADTLDSLEHEYERLMTDHGLAEWHEYTGEGTVTEGALDRLQAEERALFQRARPLAEAALARHDLSPESRRVAELWRDGALGLELVGDPEVARLAHRLETLLDSHAFMRNGARITRTDVRRLALSANPAERREARDLEGALHHEVADTARALLRRRVAVAREHGIASYGDALLRLRGIDPTEWNGYATALETRTRSAYSAVLSESEHRVSISSVTPADAAFALSSDTEWTEQRLPADRAVDFARRALGALGFDIDHPQVRVLVREFSFGGQTLSIHVPDDVRTVVRPQAGQRFYSTLMHELGHALQATRTHTTSAIFKGYEWVPGMTAPGFDEGMAETFGTLFGDEDFLSRFTEFTPDERTRLVSSMRKNALINLRSTLASVAFERAALADPEQDLDALQRRMDHEYRLLDSPTDTPPTWAATPFLATYPMYMQSYVLAAMTAAQVHAALKTRFGSQWLSPAASQLITDQLFTAGDSIAWQTRMQNATGHALAVDDLVTELTR